MAPADERRRDASGAGAVTPAPPLRAPQPGTAPSLPLPAPIAPAERIETIDVLRGFALQGILLMNILAFGLPFRAYMDPTVDGATAGADFAVYCAVELFAEGTMRALFSLLFGAGVVILAGGARPKPAGVYYRRQLLLLAFGLFDAFVLLWTGDILVLYALAGMVLYWVRGWSPKRLFVLAGLLFGYLLVFYAAMFAVLTTLPELAGAAQARLDVGAGTAADRSLVAEWAGLKAQFRPPPEALAREAVKFQGAYGDAFLANAVDVLTLYAAAYPLFLYWDALACMVLGMALYKTGVLPGTRDPRFFGVLAAVGLCVGLVVNGFELAMKIGSGFALPWVSGLSVVSYDIGRVAMALGFLSLVALACARGWFDKARRVLAAVGRMALTNYLLQSVFGLFLFHALGLGLWSELARHQLYLVVLAEWIVVALFSAWWLGRFRFGPMEWLWRALTYRRWPPMRSS